MRDFDKCYLISSRYLPFSGIDSGGGGGNTRGMPLIPDGRRTGAGGRLVLEEGERERERRDLMPLRYKSRWTERDTAEFTRHHVSGKDTAVLMPSVRRLSILPSPAHAQMIIGDELRSEVKRDGGLAIPISLILDRWMDRDRMGDSCSCPACWWLDGEGEGGGEPALLACSPFPIQKRRTDGRQRQKKEENRQ